MVRPCGVASPGVWRTGRRRSGRHDRDYSEVAGAETPEGFHLRIIFRKVVSTSSTAGFSFWEKGQFVGYRLPTPSEALGWHGFARTVQNLGTGRLRIIALDNKGVILIRVFSIDHGLRKHAYNETSRQSSRRPGSPRPPSVRALDFRAPP